MKHIFSLLLSVVMLLSFTACTAGTDSDTDTDTPTTTTAPSGETDDGAEDAGDADDTQTDDEQPEGASTFAEQVIIDNEACTIKITGVEEDALFGFTLKVYLENKSTDTTYMFAVDNASINGVKADPFFATEVAAGMKANEEISFMADELEEYGIGQFTDIALAFSVSDAEDWMAEPVAEASAHVYPYGEENKTTFVREPQGSDVVIMDNDQVKVTVIGYAQDEFLGYTVNMYIENKSDMSLMLSAEDVAVNGYMLDPFYAEMVSAGVNAFSSMSWFTEDFEDNGITAVDSIAFALRVYDDEDWLADALASEDVTLNP